VIEAAAIGVAAGIVSGMLGVGGGVLFVPGLVIVIGLTQVDAEATSLLGDGMLIGVLSVLGAVGGVALANVLSGEALRIAFAVLTLIVAVQLARGGLRGGEAS
jgi:uncharacterized membrane protein YfcA